MGIMAMLMKAPAAAGNYTDDRDAGWTYLPAGYWGQGNHPSFYDTTYTWANYNTAFADTGQPPSAQITFTGTQVAVIAGTQGTAGHVVVKIDGALVGTYDTPAGSIAGSLTLFTSGALSSGSHTILLTCTSGQVVVDAIQVTP